ncbi:MAG: hypothetical protein JWL76_748 [Thermoleophilia bacterium]|nr:hypothetical protein [Thermoleophilia bacterium]
MFRSLARPSALSLVMSLALALTGATSASAAVVRTSGTTLSFIGDSGADQLHVAQTSATRIEFDGGAVSLTETSLVCDTIPDVGDAGPDGGANIECNGAVPWTTIVIELGDGADISTPNSFAGTQPVVIPMTIRGGAGDDALTGGPAADNIDAGTGAANAQSGLGNDTITSAGGDNDFVSLVGGATTS